MKIRFIYNLKSWSLIPTIGVRTRADIIMFEWLCFYLSLERTLHSNYWHSKHFCISVCHCSTHLSFPTIRIGLEEPSIYLSFLGFSMTLRYFSDDDLPF